MKVFKRLFIGVSLFAIGALSIQTAEAKKIQIQKNALPKTAIEFLDQNFSQEPINFITEDKEWFDTDYSVLLNNMTEIEFDKNGNWTDVSNKTTAIPTDFILPAIVSHVKTNFANAHILKIEKDNRQFEVKLSNSLELVFDNNGTFMRIDD
ncbi:PepSY-like domain-containing protein [Myroides pelagicus]|uniref:Putative beta-lactamase-inhibitor-like PepSY-like domain-containing protein n=1 Tax=Myroides pelagicus TaxID=270914 RepID=A0A7K1GKC2_9FLAO|nr:PepSY-like domain-containing protein [Myroides pelagicus]MEC4113459.1 PepSY-like domain-containing protein [Myroides pelagicus]MTH29258.1 hypothetical protein [Myroides pelagicus]